MSTLIHVVHVPTLIFILFSRSKLQSFLYIFKHMSKMWVWLQESKVLASVNI